MLTHGAGLMKILFTILLDNIVNLQDTIDPDVIESTSSNPGLVIAAGILVAIVITGVILHTYSKRTN
jgi:hypothetical protein